METGGASSGDGGGTSSPATTERVALGYRCSHCNKPLPLRVTGIIACPACAGENYVELPAGAARPSPDRVPMLVLVGVLAMFALAMVSAVVGVVWVYRQTRSIAPIDVEPGPRPRPDPKDVPRPPAPGPSEIISWVGSGGGRRPCLAAVDSNGTTGIVGFGTAGSAVDLMAVSATSGRVLWQNRELTTNSGSLWCDGRGSVVILIGPAFSASAIDARTGRHLWTTKLPDRPEAVSFGDGCLNALAIDQSLTTLALATGAPAPCPSAPAPKVDWARKLDPIEASGFTLSFSTVKPGSPRIIVTGWKESSAGWTQTLAIANDSPWATPYALDAATLLVAGVKPGTTEMGVVKLDVTTGAILAARDISMKELHGTTFVHLATSDRHVFLQTFGKLYALRLPELDLLWEAGSMW